jgi:hypothetical protein
MNNYFLHLLKVKVNFCEYILFFDKYCRFLLNYLFFFVSFNLGILPEALRTKCSRCSITQKENALKIITTLHEQYPDQYNNLAGKWDPTGEYNRRFEEYLNNKEYNQISNEERPIYNASK